MLVDGKRVEVIEHHRLARMASTREPPTEELSPPPELRMRTKAPPWQGCRLLLKGG